jgi:hypothetical protein
LRYLSLINTWGVTVYPLKRNLVPRFDNKIRGKPTGEITCLMRKSKSLMREWVINVYMAN